jgi:hypothetical protein
LHNMTTTKIKILFYLAAATIVIPGILHLNMGLSQLLHNPAVPTGGQPRGGSFSSGSNNNNTNGGATQSSTTTPRALPPSAGGGSGILGLTGIFFTVAGIAQIFWGLPMARRWGTPWYLIGIAGNVVLIALWAITRMPGNPISERAFPLAAGIYDEVLQVAFIVITAAIIIYERRMKRMDPKTAADAR